MANAVLLPHVLRFNAPACQPALGRVAHACGKTSHALAAIEAVEQLNSRLNIPACLSEVGVSQDFIPEMPTLAFASGNAQIVNPRKPTLEEIVRDCRVISAAFVADGECRTRESINGNGVVV